MRLISETLEEVRKRKEEAKAMKPTRKPSGGKAPTKQLLARKAALLESKLKEEAEKQIVADETTEETKSVDEGSDTSSKKSEKKKRGPTAYNLFIKAEMERLRAADPKINHKVSMSMAVAAWKSKDQVQVQVQEKPEVTLENILSA